MKISVVRKWFYKERTIGEMFVDGNFFGYTLEDFVRKPGDSKIYGSTAINAGKYGVIANMSSRFKKILPLLLNVPGFEGIRIHGGNTESDTLGCILVGKSTNKTTRIWDCAERISTLTDLITKNKGTTIEIIDKPEGK